jgi:hypothetical protein
MKVVAFCYDVLRVDAEAAEISTAHVLLPPCTSLPGFAAKSSIMVRFTTFTVRDEVFHAKSCLLTYNSERQRVHRVFLNKNLTADRSRQLLAAARSNVCNGTIKRAWTPMDM